METNINERIKQLRKEKGISMEDMAQELNLLYGCKASKSMISRWEKDGDPSLSYARILSKYFNVSLGYLMGIEGRQLEEVAKDEDAFADLKGLLDFYQISSGKFTLDNAPQALVNQLSRVALSDMEKYLQRKLKSK